MIKASLYAIAAAASLSALVLAQNPGPERLAAVEIRAERVAYDLYVLFGAVSMRPVYRSASRSTAP